MDARSERIETCSYEVPGWGVGQITYAGATLLAHELPSRDRTGPGSTQSLGLLRHRSGSAPLASPPPLAGPAPLAGSAPLEGGAEPPDVTVPGEDARVCASIVSDLARQVTRHLNGDETSYAGVHLDLGWCTPFQAELARALFAVPWGEVVSYGELAALAGRPGAARAAGSFCAQNRYALVIPCHRVVSAAGIGGYGDSGVHLKRRLLALEGVDL